MLMETQTAKTGSFGGAPGLIPVGHFGTIHGNQSSRRCPTKDLQSIIKLVCIKKITL
jgi:hypothetical protein